MKETTENKALQRQKNESENTLSTTHEVQGADLAFPDERPSAMQLKALQSGANDSPQVQQLKTLQLAANQRAESPAASLAASPAVDKGLPSQLKQGMEAMSGMDMSDVQVHRNSSKPAEVGAHAYAQGSEIHLAPGQEQHLPHEAWHVVQQRQGRVQATTNAENGTAINDDKSLESEADAMGAKAMQMKAAAGVLQEKTATTQAPLQRMAAGPAVVMQRMVTEMTFRKPKGKQAPEGEDKKEETKPQNVSSEKSMSVENNQGDIEMGGMNSSYLTTGQKTMSLSGTKSDEEIIMGGSDDIDMDLKEDKSTDDKMSEEDQEIVQDVAVLCGVKIIGRPDKVFSDTMGDHTTAFAVHRDGLKKQLMGKSIGQAAGVLTSFFNSCKNLPGYAMIGNLPEKQSKRLKAAELTVSQLLDKDNWALTIQHISDLQEAVNALLELRELIPLSTINVRRLSASAGKGKGEAKHVKTLVKHTKNSPVGIDERKTAMKGLFDFSALGKGLAQQNVGMLNAMVPGLASETSMPDRIEGAIEQHLLSMEMAFPEAFDDNLTKKILKTELQSQLHGSLDEAMVKTYWEIRKDQKNKGNDRRLAFESNVTNIDSVDSGGASKDKANLEKAESEWEGLNGKANTYRKWYFDIFEKDIPDDEVYVLLENPNQNSGSSFEEETDINGKKIQRRKSHRKLQNQAQKEKEYRRIEELNKSNKSEDNDSESEPEFAKKRRLDDKKDQVVEQVTTKSKKEIKRQEAEEKRKLAESQKQLAEEEEKELYEEELKSSLGIQFKVDDEEKITHIEMAGRTKSPFGSSTMGAHTTAWVVHLDRIKKAIMGKTILEALDAMDNVLVPEAFEHWSQREGKFEFHGEGDFKMNDAKGRNESDTNSTFTSFPLEDINLISENIPEIHETISEPDSEVDDFDDEIQEEFNAKMDEGDEKYLTQHQSEFMRYKGQLESLQAREKTKLEPIDKLVLLRGYINSLLTFINYMPGSTIDAANTNGRGEAKHRKVLQSHSTAKKTRSQLEEAIKGLFDSKEIDNSDQKQLLEQQHNELIEGAYPDVHETLKKRFKYVSKKKSNRSNSDEKDKKSGEKPVKKKKGSSSDRDKTRSKKKKKGHPIEKTREEVKYRDSSSSKKEGDEKSKDNKKRKRHM